MALLLPMLLEGKLSINEQDKEIRRFHCSSNGKYEFLCLCQYYQIWSYEDTYQLFIIFKALRNGIETRYS
jgi:hypothetical protein